MVLNRYFAAAAWLVLGAAACSLLVRGTVDSYPAGDGDGDSDADTDGDGDVDAGTDAGDDAARDATLGIDSGCVGGDRGQGPVGRCDTFCDVQVGCAGDLDEANCPGICDCYMGGIYKPEFAWPLTACLNESRACIDSDAGSSCSSEAYEEVDSETCGAFVDLCLDRARELRCNGIGGPAIDCEMAPALRVETIDVWVKCLKEETCVAINQCRDWSFLRLCGLVQ